MTAGPIPPSPFPKSRIDHDVFISYSRRDKEFVRQLFAALEAEGRDAWVDWEDIPITADWWQEIERGIEGANTFIFVLSPDSIASTVCNKEIVYAVQHNKRLVPIVRREGFNSSQVNPELNKRNWLFFREIDGFDAAFQTLLKTLDTDLEYVRTHTRLLIRAIEWDRRGRDDSFLLRKSDLTEAETWLAGSDGKEPIPTDLQRGYIQASRTIENAYYALLQRGQQAQRQVRVAAVVIPIAVAIAGSTGIFAWRATTIAQNAEQSLERSRADLDTIRKGNELERAGIQVLRQFPGSGEKTQVLISAVRLGKALQTLAGNNRPLKDYPATSPILTLQVILDSLAARSPRSDQQATLRLPPDPAGAITSLAFSPNGLLAIAREDGSVSLLNSAGQQQRRFATDQGSITSLNFSPDGNTVATTGQYGQLRFWRLSDFAPQGSFELPQGIITRANFSPDGQLLVTRSGDNRVQVWGWDWQQLRASERGELTRDNDLSPIMDISIKQGRSSDDQPSMATVTLDGRVQLWTISGRFLSEFNSYQNEVRQISFSPDGERIATVGLDGVVRIWNLAGLQIGQVGDINQRVVRVRFTPDGQLLAIAFASGQLQEQPVWQLADLLTAGCQQLQASTQSYPEVSQVCPANTP